MREKRRVMMELNGTMETNAAPLQQRAERAGRNHRLESIKRQRRRVRREKWLPGTRSLANVVAPSAETVN